MRKLKVIAIVAVGVLIVAQLFRIDKTNPPVESDLSVPPHVRELLTRSCYGCHSNETAWPWYSEVAPASWLVAYDVHQGRAELNFSRWGNYSPSTKQKKLKEIAHEVAEGDMPPWYYVYPMHPEARFSVSDSKDIADWVSSEAALLDHQSPPAPTQQSSP